MQRPSEVPAITAAAAEACSLHELGERVLPRMLRLTGASAGLFYRYDDAGRIVSIAGEIADLMDHYARHYLRCDPVHDRPRALAPEPRVVFATRLVDRGAYQRSEAYGEFYRAYELDHLACIWLTHAPYQAPGMTGLLLARGRRSGEFERTDERAIAGVLPVLAAAVARAARLHELERQRDALAAIAAGPAAAARMILSRAGAPIWMSPSASALLPSIPAALRGEARRLADGGPARAAPLAVERGVVAQLSIVRDASGEPLVLVELASERGAVAELARRLGLTNAEAAVLRHVARGLSNAAIADELGSSVETVRTHVRHVLAKLGVETRVQAALIATRGA
ncbi:MAG TPA: helix-turn-helix transcriptional regulator [Kofleriaceae bacterium]|nr:helix-turn-helix transcriptional regulator [Kofleriaceae bacterium]